MHSIPYCLFFILLFTARAWSGEVPNDLVHVQGGEFKHVKSNYYGNGTRVADFYIGRTEVTQKQWRDVMGTDPSEFKGDDHPVEMISWYDCIEYCNARSLKEGLTPAYRVEKTVADPRNQNELDDLRWTVTRVLGANGYRLPTEVEWEYAAGGGQASTSRTYSGDNRLDPVGWFWQNSGDQLLEGMWNWPAVQKNNGRTQPVATKASNELGIHDMSGNVREWCWDWYGDGPAKGENPGGPESGVFRVWKGGGWMGGDFCCEPSFRANFEPHSRGYDQGFRVARDAK